jgi:hypothetical protein
MFPVNVKLFHSTAAEAHRKAELAKRRKKVTGAITDFAIMTMSKIRFGSPQEL